VLSTGGKYVEYYSTYSRENTNTEFVRHSQWDKFRRFHRTLRSWKAFSFRVFASDPLTRGCAPGPRCRGLHPQTPVIGARSALNKIPQIRPCHVVFCNLHPKPENSFWALMPCSPANFPRSAVYKVKSRGPNTEPWGTPWIDTRLVDSIRQNCWVDNLSHTHSVVRECCKGDDTSQWGNGKFDPLPRPNPLTERHQKLHTWLGPGCLPIRKVYSRSLKGFLFPVCAKFRIKIVYSAFFRVLSTAHSPGLRTDFHEQYVKGRGSTQGCAFWVR